MPYKIETQDGKHCVVKSDGSKTIHCYDTEAEAKELMKAMYANVPDATKESGGLLDALKGIAESALRALHLAEPEPLPLLSTFKSKDGETWLLTWVTNAFKDSDGEIFTTKALEDYVDRHEADAEKGKIMFWHIPGTEFASVKWRAMSGRFLVEASVFDPTPIGEAFKEFLLANPKGHPTVAPVGYGCSHGYQYKQEDRADAVYDWLEKHETSVLPSDKAANKWNPRVEVISMNDAQRAALKTIGGDDLVRLVEDTGKQRTKDLEATTAYKEADSTLEVKTMSDELKEQAITATPAAEPAMPVAVVSDYLTKAEATSAFEALAQNTKALQDTLATLTGDLATVAQELLALKEAQAKAEKAQENLSHSPLASIQAILGQSVIGRKEAEVTPDLSRAKPKETKAAGVTGIEFIDSMLNPAS